MLERVLIPLLRPKIVFTYLNKLSSCLQELGRQYNAVKIVVTQSLIKLWPWKSHEKQLLFIPEFAYWLLTLNSEDLTILGQLLNSFIPQLLSQSHCLVVEKVFLLWNCPKLLGTSYIGRRYASTLLPVIYGPLTKQLGHWDDETAKLAKGVLHKYRIMTPHIFDICRRAHEADKEKVETLNKDIKLCWEKVQLLAEHNFILKSSVTNK